MEPDDPESTPPVPTKTEPEAFGLTPERRTTSPVPALEEPDITTTDPDGP